MQGAGHIGPRPIDGPVGHKTRASGPALPPPLPHSRKMAGGDQAVDGPVLIAFNKPMNMLSQFTDEGQWQGLRHAIDVSDVYAAGRLDRDSEGLLLLTSDGALQARISNPKHKLAKTYFVLVEGVPDAAALDALRRGVALKDGKTRPARVAAVPEPDWLWPRTPPVRIRQSVTDSWLRLTITEGKNRQIRRMTAAVGLPTLRLVRCRIDLMDGKAELDLKDLPAGRWRPVTNAEQGRLNRLLSSSRPRSRMARRGADRRG